MKKNYLFFVILLLTNCLIYAQTIPADVINQFNDGQNYRAKEDYVNAAKCYKYAAEHGLAAAQYELAMCYERGVGVNQNLKEAFKWFKMAADGGWPLAYVSVGTYYYEGVGVTRDLIESVKWYKKASDEFNDVESQYCLGMAYERGDGVNIDYTEAAKWYQKSAEGGHPYAANNLAHLYLRGQGVDKNENTAYYWFRKSAEGGDMNAQCSMGAGYLEGLGGLPVDKKEAMRWFKMAAKQGMVKAQIIVNKLENGEI